MTRKIIRCADKQPSKFFPSFHWSLAACGASYQPPTSSNSLVEGQQEGSLVVEMHVLWNFTSTYTECRNYCSLAERFKAFTNSCPSCFVFDLLGASLLL